MSSYRTPSEGFEPLAQRIGNAGHTYEVLTASDLALVSAAISLKRIADVLESGGNVGSIENTAYYAGQAFRRGMGQ